MSRKDYNRAKQKVKKKKEFIEHLNSYIGVMVILFVINIFIARGGGFWMIYPMMGWGFGLLIHYFSVFGLPGLKPIDDDWEEEEIRREMERQQRKRNYNDEEDDYKERDLEGRRLPDYKDEKELPEIPKQKDKLEDLIDGDTFRD